MHDARMKKKTFRALAGAAIAAALIVTPMVTTGAVAAVPTSQEGQIGVLQSWTEETNHVEYWQGQYPGATCVKGEASTGNVTVSGTGLSVTLNAAPTGQQWVALIIKAGNQWNNVVANPQVGVAYASPDNNGDQQAVVSHWFACYTPTTPESHPEKPAPVSTQDVKKTFECGSDETITTTTTTTDWVWDDASSQWVTGTPVTSEPVVTRAALTLAEQQTCQSENTPPTTTVTYTEWTDGAWTCGDTTVTQTRTKTTTVSQADGTSTTSDPVTETRTRDLTHDELGTCPLTPGDIASECVGDVPYLSYDVSLPAGFVPAENPSTPLTITFVNPNKGGVDYVVKGLSLKGEILWPGASDVTPKMWPGWELQNGQYVKTTGNFDWTRQGVTVRFDVNPTYSTTVTYPKATALCASPSLLAADPTPDPTPTPTVTSSSTPMPLAVTGDGLASTGGTGVSPLLVASGIVALAAGVAGVTIAGIRRRRGEKSAQL